MQLTHYRFRPKLIPTLATIALLPILVSLGLWQSDKARQKQELLDTYDAGASQPGVLITPDLVNAESYRYKKVMVRGRFDATYQILLDNRVHKAEAGYHVITPLKIENSNVYILINRGWLPVGSDRAVLPQISTPTELLEISGIATLPPSKIYTLKPDENIANGWLKVWQNLDFKRYQEATHLVLQPVVIQMDKDGPGGFVHDWSRPDLRMETNLGYAFQWYGMAAILVLIYIGSNIQKTKKDEKNE